VRKTIQAGYIRKHRGWWEVRYRERVGMGATSAQSIGPNGYAEWMSTTKLKNQSKI